MAGRVKVFNVITKLSVGGAQETALRYCALLGRTRWETVLVTGPESSPEGDLFEQADALEVNVSTVPALHRSIRPVADVRALVALVRLFRRERPDIVHTHSSKAGLLGRLAARVAGVPVIVHTVHGWSFHQDMPRVVRAAAIAAERLAGRWTSRLVVVTDRDAELGRAAGIGRPGAYDLVRSGIDLPRYDASPAARTAARARLGLPEGVPVVGTVTRLCRQKDPWTLLAAIRRVVEARPDAHAVVIGDGPLRKDVEIEVDRLGLRDHVTLLGPRDDVADLLPAFDVFLLTSRWEGLPRVVVEAMAAGLPVVSTDVGGIAEVVSPATGALARPGDALALAEEVLNILGNSPLASSLGRAAVARVAEFDAGRMIADLEKLYLSLLPAGRSVPRRRLMARATARASGHEAA